MFIQDREWGMGGLLDARKIGAYISKLRKGSDMTQMEMAEKLNVSHQAVSKWERGESLPDIGTIPPVAAMFGLTVDELLRGGDAREAFAGENGRHEAREERIEAQRGAAAIVERLAMGRPEQAAALVNAGDAPPEALVEVAPLVKASELRRVAEGLSPDRIDWELIVRLAPFLPEETIDELVRHAMADGTAWDRVAQLAPFLGKPLLGELTERTIDGALDYRLIVSLAPFLDREQLDRLVIRAEEGGLDWHIVVSLAPFVGRETLNRLADRVADGELDPGRLIGLAPFLGRETIAKLIGRLDLDRADPNLAASLAPFLDQSTLAALVRGMLERAKQG